MSDLCFGDCGNCPASDVWLRQDQHGEWVCAPCFGLPADAFDEEDEAA